MISWKQFLFIGCLGAIIDYIIEVYYGVAFMSKPWWTIIIVSSITIAVIFITIEKRKNEKQ
jgi:uncharacterized membrane protein YdjX (TVP38/TMEM64 family)